MDIKLAVSHYKILSSMEVSHGEVSRGYRLDMKGKEVRLMKIELIES